MVIDNDKAWSRARTGQDWWGIGGDNTEGPELGRDSYGHIDLLEPQTRLVLGK